MVVRNRIAAALSRITAAGREQNGRWSRKIVAVKARQRKPRRSDKGGIVGEIVEVLVGWMGRGTDYGVDVDGGNGVA